MNENSINNDNLEVDEIYRKSLDSNEKITKKILNFANRRAVFSRLSKTF